MHCEIQTAAAVTIAIIELVTRDWQTDQTSLVNFATRAYSTQDSMAVTCPLPLQGLYQQLLITLHIFDYLS